MNRELFDSTPARKRSREDILRAVREAAEPAAASFGLEVWGIELAGAGRPVVRIYVDAPVSMREPDAPFLSAGDDAPGVQGGAGVEQCAEISRMVGLALDVEEIFPDAWTLEISSPGSGSSLFPPFPDASLYGAGAGCQPVGGSSRMRAAQKISGCACPRRGEWLHSACG